MINICEEFAKCHSIVFNPSKTNPINPISKRKSHLVIAYIIFVLENHDLYKQRKCQMAWTVIT